MKKKFNRHNLKLSELAVLEYCLKHKGYMFADTIMGLILDCDFREASEEAEWTLKLKRK